MKQPRPHQRGDVQGDTRQRHASETRVIVGLQSVTGAEKYNYKTRKPEECGQSQGISSAAVVYEKGGPGLLPATAV